MVHVTPPSPAVRTTLRPSRTFRTARSPIPAAQALGVRWSAVIWTLSKLCVRPASVHPPVWVAQHMEENHTAVADFGCKLH